MNDLVLLYVAPDKPNFYSYLFRDDVDNEEWSCMLFKTCGINGWHMNSYGGSSFKEFRNIDYFTKTYKDLETIEFMI